MNTVKKIVVILMLALSALPAFADVQIDQDGDGIPNGRDVCPLAYGMNSDGCPSGNYTTGPQPTLPQVSIDQDGDGIPNGRDLCPLAYGMNSDGCPSGSYTSSPQPTLPSGGGGGDIIVFDIVDSATKK